MGTILSILKRTTIVALVILLSSCKGNMKVGENHEENVVENKDKSDFKIIAYATPSMDEIDAETARQLNQIIYSFLHLEGNDLATSEKDLKYLDYLNSLKKINPDLKVLISLGGWGGCETCSDVFSDQKGREQFALSVKQLMQRHNLDGIDLDWEYPVIEGYPGHAFKPADRQNFTSLVEELREVLGPDYVISFAAGGFKDYLQKAVDWKKVMPLVDHVNIMSYDIVNGNSKKTGHHTSLFSTPNQKNSTDSSIRYLDSIGIPHEKMVIGAAFYARVWKDVGNLSHGLYQEGNFKESVAYKELEGYFKKNSGFQNFWDSTAHAPFSYNAEKGLFATFDDSLSVAQKTTYVMEKGLGGIMFWQLTGDKAKNGLLDVIYHVKENAENN